ncbi:MAG: hypothetical protein JWO80_394 [Bryobacterales bacterium]|nr:hypothetical protein [Bryobacterales bacterium]
MVEGQLQVARLFRRSRISDSITPLIEYAAKDRADLRTEVLGHESIAHAPPTNEARVNPHPPLRPMFSLASIDSREVGKLEPLAKGNASF